MWGCKDLGEIRVSVGCPTHPIPATPAIRPARPKHHMHQSIDVQIGSCNRLIREINLRGGQYTVLYGRNYPIACRVMQCEVVISKTTHMQQAPLARILLWTSHVHHMPSVELRSRGPYSRPCSLTQRRRLDSCSGNKLPTTSHFQSLSGLKKLPRRLAVPAPAPAQLPHLYQWMYCRLHDPVIL